MKQKLQVTMMIVKDTQNLDALVFCFSLLMTIGAPVLFGVYTNLTFLHLLLLLL